MQSHSDRNPSVPLKEADGPLHSYIPDFTDSLANRGSIETTEVYLHASMAMKEKALAKATASKTRNDRYRSNDSLLAFLKRL
jgi:hypothetical protein